MASCSAFNASHSLLSQSERARSNVEGSAVATARISGCSASGERFTTSVSRVDLLYAIVETTCECPAALAGDPIGQHRAALRSILGTWPVVTVRIDEMIPANTPRCATCAGAGEEWVGGSPR